MKLLLFLTMGIVFLVAAQDDDGEKDREYLQRWMRQVEMTLSSISIGPLRKDLGPSHFANRTRKGVIAQQTMRFRARVVSQIADALLDSVAIEIPPEICDEAVKQVLDDLVEHTFEARLVSNVGEAGEEGTIPLKRQLVVSGLGDAK